MFPFNKTIALIAAGVLFAAWPGIATAQEQQEEESTGSTFMSQPTYNRLSRAHTAIEEGKYDEALDNLLDLASDVRERPYEYAVTLQTIGYVYINQEKWEQAAQYMEQALNQNALPKEPEKSLIYALAQIYSTLGRFQETVRLMTDWFKTAENPPPDAYIIVANAHASLDQYQQAYPYVKQANAKAEKPKEDWYKLQLAIEFELGKMREARSTLETLVANWPDKQIYWKQLSGVYIELGDDAKALAAMAMAHERGLIEKSDDLLNLARLYMLNEVPFKGAQILERALENNQVERTQKNYELLAQAWIQAREYEKGIAALHKAGALADDGKLFIRAAQLETSLADWEGAMDAARKAIEKGGLDSEDTGKAWLLLGTAAAESKDFDTAITAFNKARGYPETRKTASQWLSFVETERQVTGLN